MDPRTAATDAEHSTAPTGTDERFSGYGVMGIPFSSGHILAMRRFPVSTVGPGYNAVWLRDPRGAWTMAATTPPQQSCARYFGGAVEHQIQAPVDLQWADGHTLRVIVPEPLGLDWVITLRATALTRAMSTVCAALPDPLWRQPWFSSTMAAVAAVSLGTGTMRLIGRTPNRQHFVARPRRIWLISDSTARLGGQDLGRPAPLSEQTSLGDFWLPQRGLFMVGWSAFAPAP